VESVVLWEGFKGKILKGMTMGISDEFFDIGRNRLTEVRGKTLRVGFVGRFTPAKGLKILIDAFDGAAGANDMTLDIVGSGDYEPEVRSHVATKNNSHRIFIRGFVPYDEVHQLLGRFDVVVLCSEAKGKALEQFGRVLAEAQAAGCVVIGSDLGGIPNAIRTGGYVIPEGSVEHLEAKLKYLASCDDEAFNSMRLAGFTSALENFSDPVLGREIFKNISSAKQR
jgi:glycosyltransferase involved in cell wall biosynthesis